MKRIALVLTLVGGSWSVVAAQSADPLQSRVFIDYHDAAAVEVITALASAAGLTADISPGALRPVTITLTNVRLCLRKCLVPVALGGSAESVTVGGADGVLPAAHGVVRDLRRLAARGVSSVCSRAQRPLEHRNHSIERTRDAQVSERCAERRSEHVVFDGAVPVAVRSRAGTATDRRALEVLFRYPLMERSSNGAHTECDGSDDIGDDVLHRAWDR